MTEMSLKDRLLIAKSEVAQLEAQIANASCAEVGHDWRFVGGRQASCPRGGDCQCSVPVNECARCGESDYGTADAEDEVLNDCIVRYDDGPIDAMGDKGET